MTARAHPSRRYEPGGRWCKSCMMQQRTTRRRRNGRRTDGATAADKSPYPPGEPRKRPILREQLQAATVAVLQRAEVSV